MPSEHNSIVLPVTVEALPAMTHIPQYLEPLMELLSLMFTNEFSMLYIPHNPPDMSLRSMSTTLKPSSEMAASVSSVFAMVLLRMSARQFPNNLMDPFDTSWMEQLVTETLTKS